MAACRGRNRVPQMPLRLVLLFLLFIASPALAADRTVYLTFDDGPLNGTANILDVLQAEQVPADIVHGRHACRGQYGQPGAAAAGEVDAAGDDRQSQLQPRLQPLPA